MTRLASEELIEATPQRGFRVRPLSVEHLRDLTWVRVQLESLALRESIAKGDVSWEADLVAAHHRLAVTPTYFEDGTGNLEWLTAHSGFHCRARGAQRAVRSSNGSGVSSTTRPSCTACGRATSRTIPIVSTSTTSTERSSKPRWPATRTGGRSVDPTLETTAHHLEAIAPDVNLVS